MLLFLLRHILQKEEQSNDPETCESNHGLNERVITFILWVTSASDTHSVVEDKLPMTALNPSHNCGRIYFFLAASRCERLCGLLNGRRKSFSFLMQHSFHLAAAATQLSSELLVHNVITCIPSVRQQEIVPSADCHLGSPCVSVLCSVPQTTSSVKRLIYRALMTKFSAHFEKAKWSANVREVLRTGDSKNFWSCGATVVCFFLLTCYLLPCSLFSICCFSFFCCQNLAV